jgi:hypothetical protein
MHGRNTVGTAWLSLTPEPERSLPELLALLQEDGAAAGSPRHAEEGKVTQIVLRGTSRRWLRYLDRATALALAVANGERAADPELALAVVEVVLEHDRMLIGLPGGAYHRTAERRRALREAQLVLRQRIAATR